MLSHWTLTKSSMGSYSPFVMKEETELSEASNLPMAIYLVSGEAGIRALEPEQYKANNCIVLPP